MKENLMEIDRAKEPYTYITISSLEKMGKQIERLQEQLKEANELISLLFPLSTNKERAIERTTEYMEKWGVK